MEQIISLKKYGMETLPNMMMLAKYLSNGGPVIIKRKNESGAHMTFYDKEGNETWWTPNIPDVNAGLMIVYGWLEDDTLESWMLYLEDAFIVYDMEERLVKSYLMNRYKDKDPYKINYNREYVELSQEDFKKKIVSFKNNNIVSGLEEFCKMFDINKTLSKSMYENLVKHIARYANIDIDIPPEIE